MREDVVVKDVKEANAEAIRVIETTAKKWSCGYMPGTGEPMDATITYPIVFQL